MTDGQSGYSSTQVNNIISSLNSVNYYSVGSETDIDSIPQDYQNRTYYQLYNANDNAKGTSPRGLRYGIVETKLWSSINYAVQTFFEADTSHRIFIRYKNENSWGTWKQIAFVS